MADLPRCDAVASAHSATRSWSLPSTRRCSTVERRLVGPSLTSAWRDLATAERLSDAGVVELSRSFCTTDDALVECMTCGVVGEVSDLRVRTVHHVPNELAGGPRQTLVSIACPVCSSRGSVVLTAGPTVPVRLPGPTSA